MRECGRYDAAPRATPSLLHVSRRAESRPSCHSQKPRSAAARSAARSQPSGPATMSGPAVKMHPTSRKTGCTAHDHADQRTYRAVQEARRADALLRWLGGSGYYCDGHCGAAAAITVISGVRNLRSCPRCRPVASHSRSVAGYHALCGLAGRRHLGGGAVLRSDGGLRFAARASAPPPDGTGAPLPDGQSCPSRDLDCPAPGGAGRRFSVWGKSSPPSCHGGGLQVPC